jgi:hypothetical protein
VVAFVDNHQPDSEEVVERLNGWTLGGAHRSLDGAFVEAERLPELARHLVFLDGSVDPEKLPPAEFLEGNPVEIDLAVRAARVVQEGSESGPRAPYASRSIPCLCTNRECLCSSLPTWPLISAREPRR